MALVRSLMLAGLVLGAPLWAQPSTTETASAAAVRVKARLALTANAPLPTERPTLPDSASDRGGQVHRTTAFGQGQKGVAQKAARAEAATRVTAPTSAKAAAKGAASKGNSDARAAAGQTKITKKPLPGANERPDNPQRP